jgi:hypothetical protein
MAVAKYFPMHARQRTPLALVLPSATTPEFTSERRPGYGDAAQAGRVLDPILAGCGV